MASRHNEWAYEIANHYRLKPNLRVVFLALAHHRNKKTGMCHPSQETIAIYSGINRRTTQRNLESLKDMGAITITQRFKNNRQLTNLYGFPPLN
jgi:DNA-binding transcriptional MocR family regulator